jgi:hypothetical protein
VRKEETETRVNEEVWKDSTRRTSKRDCIQGCNNCLYHYLYVGKNIISWHWKSQRVGNWGGTQTKLIHRVKDMCSRWMNGHSSQ